MNNLLKRYKKKTILLLFALLTLSLVGCGYHLTGHGRALPEKFKTISIPVFQNRTAEENLDIQVSSVIRREFLIDGRLKLVKGENADLTVTGIVVGYSNSPVAFEANSTQETNKLSLTVSIDVKDNLDNKYNIIQNISASKDYKTSSSIAGSDINKINAIKSASQDIAQSMLSAIVENF